MNSMLRWTTAEGTPSVSIYNINGVTCQPHRYFWQKCFPPECAIISQSYRLLPFFVTPLLHMSFTSTVFFHLRPSHRRRSQRAGGPSDAGDPIPPAAMSRGRAAPCGQSRGKYHPPTSDQGIRRVCHPGGRDGQGIPHPPRRGHGGQRNHPEGERRPPRQGRGVAAAGPRPQGPDRHHQQEAQRGAQVGRPTEAPPKGGG